MVAAQAGFLDGPRVLANMAIDSWMPHRFAHLSDRLVAQNGVVVMGVAAALALGGVDQSGAGAWSKAISQRLPGSPLTQVV